MGIFHWYFSLPEGKLFSWICLFDAWKKFQTYSPKWWLKMVIYHGTIRNKITLHKSFFFYALRPPKTFNEKKHATTSPESRQIHTNTSHNRRSVENCPKKFGNKYWRDTKLPQNNHELRTVQRKNRDIETTI